MPPPPPPVYIALPSPGFSGGPVPPGLVPHPNPYPYYDYMFLTGQHPPGTYIQTCKSFEQGRDSWQNAHYTGDLYPSTQQASRHQAVQQTQSRNPAGGFESVELGVLKEREGQEQREKVPRRIIHFSSGETMEEYSTDEEEGEDKELERKDLLSSPVEPSKLTWGPYFWFHMWRAATSTISACDYLGERMASLFGITSAKYQYAIDEYYRMKKEREEENEENRLSEEAERSFDQLQSPEDEDEPIAMPEQRDVPAALPDVTYQIENENRAPSNTMTVPAIVTAT